MVNAFFGVRCPKMVSLNRQVVYFRNPLMFIFFFLLQEYLIESLIPLEIQVDKSISRLKTESFCVVTSVKGN